MFQMRDDSNGASVAVQFQTAKGNPANVDGKPEWTVSNPELVDLVVADDGMSVTIKPKGPLGTCQLNLTADADLGEGTKEITGQLEIEVVAGEAAVAVLTPTPL